VPSEWKSLDISQREPFTFLPHLCDSHTNTIFNAVSLSYIGWDNAVSCCAPHATTAANARGDWNGPSPEQKLRRIGNSRDVYTFFDAIGILRIASRTGLWPSNAIGNH
jgi:hypothetical protein